MEKLDGLNVQKCMFPEEYDDIESESDSESESDDSESESDDSEMSILDDSCNEFLERLSCSGTDDGTDGGTGT